MDHATPNLPSRNFRKTREFYSALGFATDHIGDTWMILSRGSVTLEFFPHPDLDPYKSWHSCCLRLEDVDGFLDICRRAGIEEKSTGFPRIHAASREGDLYMGALLDPDGSLLRVIGT